MCFHRIKLSKIKYVFISLIITSIFLCRIYQNENISDGDDDPHILLWWTDFYTPPNSFVRQCGQKYCLITTERKYKNHKKLRATLFYGSNINLTDFPLPRHQNHIWGLLHDESPKNTPFLMYEKGLNLFNYTSTFSRYSDVPMTHQFLNSINQLISDKYLISIANKNAIQRTEKIAPILYVQSICNTISDRDAYVKKLMKYIDVDSYGECLNNRRLPIELSENYISKIDSDDYYRFIARYKFVIAYENAVCNDYITEKLWRPLVVGTVPIYFGSPTVKDWLPNNKSAILINEFKNPKELAEFIMKINNDDALYRSFLDHKYNMDKPITNNNLLRGISYRNQTDNFVEPFECFMCGIESDNSLELPHFANIKHYDCDNKFVRMNQIRKDSDFGWDDVKRQGHCEAEILNDFIRVDRKYNDKEFSEEIMKRYMSEMC